jgi:hypothetical protein
MRFSSFAVGMALLLASCGGDGVAPSSPVLTEALVSPSGPAFSSGGADVVATDRPFEFTNNYVIDGFDPCNGVPDTLTVVETCKANVYSLERQVFTCKLDYTTDPGGYVGHGTGNFVSNGHVVVQKFGVTLSNEAGDRIRLQYRWVYNVSAGAPRLDEFKLTCLGR